MKNRYPVSYLLWLLPLLFSGCAGTPEVDSGALPAATEIPYEAHDRQRWLAWHRDWVGTPHRLGGNSRRGIDCSAYVRRGYEELYRIKLPRTSKQQRRKGRPIQYADLKTGDLVFFRPNTYPHHVGIYLGDGSFLHVSSRKGVTRSRLDQGYWRKYFSQGRRISE